MSRMTILDNVYFQQAGQEPINFNKGVFRAVRSEEIPYPRPHLAVGTEWQKVESGWVGDDVGLVVIHLPDESIVDRLEVTFGELPDVVLLRGDTFKATPADVSRMRIRATAECRCSILVYPK